MSIHIRAFLFAVAAFFVLLGPSPSVLAEGLPEPFSGRVVAVHDGDTLTVLTDERKTVKVRLAEVDAPECGQPWSRNAKRALSDMTYNKRVNIIPNAMSYDRVVAWVTVGDPAVDVSSALVQQSQVWVYPQFLKRPELQQIETRNRAAHLGIWSMPENQLMPPWEWRHTGHPMLKSCEE